MLGNSEKMVVMPTKTNEWPQSQIIDDQKISMASSSAHRVMEKPNQELLQQQQEALKCPRCDSSNTKFCYYNNYSLSQPRYFCKACKRYWTRGGTLRNVPVGGGCRKNKRVKRPVTSSTIDTTAPSSSSSAPGGASSNPPSQPQIDVTSTSSNINPLFYGLPSNSCDMNLPFPRFNPSGYEYQPQMNSLGLDFTSGIMYGEDSDNNYRNGFSSNNTLLSSYTSILRNSSTSTTPSTNPIMSYLLSSSLHQQKFINGAVKDGPGGGAKTFEGFASLEELPMAGNNRSSEAEMVASKDVKYAEGQNRLVWNNNGAWQNYQIEHVGLSDPSLYWNAATAMGTAWNDQTSIGPSVSSLI